MYLKISMKLKLLTHARTSYVNVLQLARTILVSYLININKTQHKYSKDPNNYDNALEKRQNRIKTTADSTN